MEGERGWGQPVNFVVKLLGIWGVWNRECEVGKGLLIVRAVPVSFKSQLGQ